MKFNGKSFVIMVAGLSLAGCYSPQGQPDYTASGALGGAAVGALLGSTGARPGQGAAIGAAVGAIAGGLVGHGMDQAQQARLRAQAPKTWQHVQQSQPLGIEDVKALAKAGVGDDLIISQIHNSRTVYHLGTGQIVDLKNSGVSEKVIDFMINTPSSAVAPPVATTAESQEVVAPPAPLVEEGVVAPGPGYVWVSGVWTWYGSRYVWVRGHWAVPPYPAAVWVQGGWRMHYGRREWAPGHWR